MDLIDAQQFTVVQLKRWLAALNLPTSGNKAELAARLNSVDSGIRGTRPQTPLLENDDILQELALDDDLGENSSVEDADPRSELISAAATRPKGDEWFDVADGVLSLQQIRAEIEAGKKELQNILAQIRDASQAVASDVINNAKNCNQAVVAGEVMQAVVGENVNEVVGEKIPNTDKSADIDIGTDIDVNKGVEQRQMAEVNKGLQSTNFSLSLAKEIIMDYDGSSCANIWTQQVRNIADLYNLDAVGVKIVIVSKLKGIAQRWLHANATRIMEPAENLLEQLILAFSDKLSKAEARRKFENLKWHHTEKFAVYFEAKTMLASSINIEPDELVDQIVEGIPAQNLRDQARIQCFTDPMQILRAFAGIRLSKPKEFVSKVITTNRSNNGGLRCANCNARGHIAKDCRKPAREPGSCYACGKFGHFVAQCEEKKGNAENNYHAS
ncbi:uncharacterized protein LOC123037584 [Drosophila rhopaloa]|uniref:Uncharacterized protein n=1 Tax=Drosophila rhopaloa TaxID=1041015 RepID=A0ABM5HA63_DRORH|nr:uncharacterized protein LOC108042988 [Drosophila rhopaloa]XP_044315007.1 uncharacterized protein LOC123037584 [Drosophila rhopaloa]